MLQLPDIKVGLNYICESQNRKLPFLSSAIEDNAEQLSCIEGGGGHKSFDVRHAYEISIRDNLTF